MKRFLTVTAISLVLSFAAVLPFASGSGGGAQASSHNPWFCFGNADLDYGLCFPPPWLSHLLQQLLP